MSPLKFQELFTCPQSRVTYFLTDTVSKGIFFKPYSDLEQQLILYLDCADFVTHSVNTYNNPDAIKALDHFIASLLDRIKTVSFGEDPRKWNLLQLTLKNGLEISFITLIGKIYGDEYIHQKDPLRNDLLYWSLTKNCQEASRRLVSKSMVVTLEHVKAVASLGGVDEIKFTLNLMDNTITVEQIYALCEELIRKHNSRSAASIKIIINHACTLGLKDSQINILAELAYKEQFVELLDTLIRVHDAKVNLMEMLMCLHKQIYSKANEELLDILILDFLKNSSRELETYFRLNLVYYLASLGAINSYHYIYKYIDLNAHFFDGHLTPLHAACAHWHTEFARVLISQRGGKCNDRDHRGDTPFHAAFKEPREYDPKVKEFIEMMLKANADYRVYNNDEHSPLDYAQVHFGNDIVNLFPPEQVINLEINDDLEQFIPFWLTMPRMHLLRRFTAENHRWCFEAKPTAQNVIQLQEMKNNFYNWKLPSVEYVNVTRGDFLAFSWVHLFRTFPNAKFYNFSYCEFSTYDAFQDQIKFLETLFKESKRDACTIDLTLALFQHTPIIFTKKQIAMWKIKFPWLTIRGEVKEYNILPIHSEEATELLKRVEQPIGAYLLHYSRTQNTGGETPTLEITQKISHNLVRTYIVRIHPDGDYLLHYKLVNNSFEYVVPYPNIFVFLATSNSDRRYSL